MAAGKYGNGLILVYTGDGKDKTTAALGQALYAVRLGKKVIVVQLMKGRKYGEVLCTEEYIPDLKFCQCGLESFVKKGGPRSLQISNSPAGVWTQQKRQSQRMNIR